MIAPVIATLALVAVLGWTIVTTHHPHEIDMSNDARKKLRQMEDTQDRMRRLAKHQIPAGKEKVG